jgi:hypothetical protein
MPEKNPATKRFGGPGASHEDRKHPEKAQQKKPEKNDTQHSRVSGGGGERDSHHTHDPHLK